MVELLTVVGLLLLLLLSIRCVSELDWVVAHICGLLMDASHRLDAV